MGDKAATMAKARQELEDLYSGVVDDSVDLTFKDMARCRQQQQQNGVAERKKKAMTANMEPIYEQSRRESNTTKELLNCPSLDFSVAFNGLTNNRGRSAVGDDRRASLEDELYNREQAAARAKGHGAADAVRGLKPLVVEASSRTYDDSSPLSQLASPFQGADGRKKRPGIPHSNICALCSEYIYIYRNRCLVCGRVYCKNCVSVGMGEMCEGRKCVQCLGRRFSQRYIEEAGQTGCCWRYSAAVKQQELIWAEKGPRRSGERRGGHQPVSGSPIVGTPTRSGVIVGTPQRSSNCPSPHNFPL